MNRKTLVLTATWGVSLLAAFSVARITAPGSATYEVRDYLVDDGDGPTFNIVPGPSRSGGTEGVEFMQDPDEPGADDLSVNEAFLALARRSPLGALKEALDERNRPTRLAKIAIALEGLNPGNLDAALELFKDMPPGFESMPEYMMLMHAWGAFDAPAAAAYASANMRGRSGGMMAGTAISTWASYDPQAAVAWFQNTEGLPGYYEYGIVRGWAQNNPYEAANYVATLEGGRMQNRYVDMIAGELVKSDPIAATDWPYTLEEGEMRDNAMRQVADEWAELDPYAAARYAAENFDSELAQKGIRDIAQEYARADYPAAAQWVDTLPAGDATNAARGQVVQQMAQQDMEAATDYVSQLQPGPASDTAYAAYVNEAAKENPLEALPYALAISDTEGQSKAITSVYQSWYNTDPEAAKESLIANSFTLSEEQIQKITSPLDDGRRRGGGF